MDFKVLCIPSRKPITKLLFIMKLTAILILAACLQLSAKGRAQSVTLSMHHSSLQKVFKEIGKQTGYNFLYMTELLNGSGKIDIEVHNASLEQVLEQCLRGTSLNYSIIEKTIVIKKKDEVQANSSGTTHDVLTIKIHGKVTDENGKALRGVSIIVRGTRVGTTTDDNGEFRIDVPDNSSKVLVFSFIGMQEQEVNINGKQEVNISLHTVAAQQQDIVVVGYGTQKRSDVTGSVSSLKGRELETAPNVRTDQAIQGRIPGVMVQNTSGGPNGGLSIRIRGANSLNYGNSPLIIIDGVQGENLANLNPNDVESIEVLKDASALSVYGWQGANGVILITTKTGKAGTASISYDGFVSADQVLKKLNVLNAQQYASLVNDAQKESGLNPIFTTSQIASLGAGTNWQNEIFKTGFTQSHSLSISGSKESLSYYVAGSYLDRTGVILNSNYRQYTLRTNLKLQANSKLSFGLISFVAHQKLHQGDPQKALISALQWSPTKTVYDSSGEYTQPGGGIGPNGIYNPVGLAKEVVSDSFTTALTISPSLEYKFNKDLKFNSLLAYKFNSTFGGLFDNQAYNDGPASNVFGSASQTRYSALQNTNIITYDKKIKEHNFKATVVYEITENEFRYITASAKGIPVSLGYNALGFGTTTPYAQPNDGLTKQASQSFMGRLNYSYKGRYLLTVSDRYDGASQLAPGHKYENFGAMAVAWNLMNEPFMSSLLSTISDLKLRASYGSVGNAAVPAYSSQQLFNTGIDANGNPILSIKQIGNPNLRWERTTETNAGIDGRLFNGRIEFTVEYYDKKTNDLLMWQTVPSALGVNAVLTNVGSVSNKGVDFSIGGTPVNSNDIKWQTNFIMGFNRNKILALDGVNDTIPQGGFADYPGITGSFKLIVGQPMGTFLGYQFAGVWKQAEASTAALYGAKPGDAKYVDINRDGKINQSDITTIGNAQPKYSFGWNNTLTYKNFDLNVFVQGVYGNKIYNENRIRREGYSSDAFPTNPVIAGHWTPANDNTDVPAFSGFENLNESRWVEDGSYLRLKNIAIGYRFFQSKSKSPKIISSARVYVSAANLFTVTHYSGFDPESSIGVDGNAGGVDRGVYPSQKSLTVGLNIKF